MSENLDLVRSIYAATGRGDHGDAAAFLNPDIEFTSMGGPDRRSGRGRVSGMEIAQVAGAEGADVLHLHDGKVIRWLSYWERDRALADLGLKE